MLRHVACQERLQKDCMHDAAYWTAGCLYEEIELLLLTLKFKWNINNDYWSGNSSIEKIKPGYKYDKQGKGGTCLSLSISAY